MDEIEDIFEFYGSNSEAEAEESNLEDISIDSESDDISVDEFTWTEDGEYLPEELLFKAEQVGFDPAFVDNVADQTPFGLFSIFFNQEMVTKIVIESNLYCRQQEEKKGVGVRRNHQWIDTTMEEIYLFLAVSMLMAHVKKHKMREYWSCDEFIETPIFSKLISRDRYWQLWTYLHFNDNEVDNSNRLHKIKPIVKQLKTKFKEVFRPYQNVCIDESLMLYKGRLKFKQYNPRKRKRFGIKSFVLCDCKTGFILDFLIYFGKQPKGDSSGATGTIVMKLMADYFDKGHILYVDNWYSSPTLFELLCQKGTGACGTVRRNRKYVPNFPKKLKKGEIVAKHTDHQLAICWKDKKEVTMLSTVHHSSMIPQEDKPSKPLMVIDYNQHMGLVDKSDMQMSFSDTTRRSMKWYKKLFF